MLPGLTWAPLPLRAATGLVALLALARGERAGAGAWAAIAVLLAAAIAVEPLAAPNHHVALTWAALAVTLSALLPEAQRHAALADSSRLLLAAIMGFAALHKSIAPGFADGAFFHFLILQGGLAGPLLEASIPGLSDAVVLNRAALDAFLWIQPAATGELPMLDPWQPLRGVAVCLAWLTLVIEAVAAVFLLYRPRAAATHALLIGFAWSVFALRQESVFLAVVCALGLAACPLGQLAIRRLYVASIVLLSALALVGISAPV